uniref:RNA-directed RNA polymerase n=1 Tax=Leviviridae sp. TaxID=2027243 RepID=A0A514D9C6_9VIRU|nr:MAG: RNA-dependent RNA polymerase [Leviviridae sp.]
MVFLSLVFLGIERGLNRQLTRRTLESFQGSVRVYGDDIICPVEFVPSVIRTLESFGFKVNAHKSFWNGKFRESCGRDYYDGRDVSIVRVRRVLPASRSDVRELVSTVELRNQLYFAGLWKTAAHLDDKLQGLLRHYPVLDPDIASYAVTGVWSTASSLLGRVSFLGSQPQKLHSDYHHPLVKGWIVSGKPPISKISGHGALLKGFLKRGELPFADRDHLERQGRPQSVSIKLRWKPPH